MFNYFVTDFVEKPSNCSNKVKEKQKGRNENKKKKKRKNGKENGRRFTT